MERICSQGAETAATIRMNSDSKSPLTTNATGLLKPGTSTASRKMPFSTASNRMTSQTTTDLSTEPPRLFRRAPRVSQAAMASSGVD